MHPVPKEVQSRVVIKLLFSWVFALRQVVIAEPLQDITEIIEEEKCLLPLDSSLDLV